MRSYDITSNKFSEVETAYEEIKLGSRAIQSPRMIDGKKSVQQPAFITNAETSKLFHTDSRMEDFTNRELSQFLSTQMSNYEREKWVYLFQARQ